MKPAALRTLKMSRIIISCLLVTNLGCMGLSSFGGPAKTPHAAKHEASLATPVASGSASALLVNKEPIEAADVWVTARDELAEVAQRTGPAEYEDYVKRLAETLIRDRISESLLYQQASLRIPKDASKRLDRIIDSELRKIISLEHDGVERRFVQHLESRGSSLEQRRETMRRQLIIASYFDNEIKPKIEEPTRAELVEAFQAHADQQRRPERRSMSLIDVKVPRNTGSTTTDGQKTAEEKIRAASAALAEGRSFASVATEFSEGLNAADGGSWGPVTPDGVREAFLPAVTALFKLDAHQVSGIVATDTHYFIVRCDEIDRPVEADFESAQPALRQDHFRLQYNRMVSERINELRANAQIEPAQIERFYIAVLRAAPGWLGKDPPPQP